MMSKVRYLAAGLLLSATVAVAQPGVNGTLAGDEAFYGGALSVQSNRTHFGDANNPDAILAGGGSEIDQVFATVSGDRLYVLITGNLEDNFNKLNVFIDSGPGGVNTLDAASLPGALDGFCCGGLEPPQGGNLEGEGALSRMNGLTFDQGFTANSLLIFTHGGESVPGSIEFNALSAHFADLDQGTGGRVGGLGMQLAPRGEPRVLRAPATNPTGDYNDGGVVDAADYTIWRDNLGTDNGLANDAIGGTIGAAHYDQWANNFGEVGESPGLDDFAFKPSGNPGNTEELLSSFELDGLGQGELIDRDYALGAGGCTDDTGAGCLAREFEFALDVDPAELGSNASSHRDFDNFVDLRLALDNSNVGGVMGSGGPDFSIVEGEDSPESVVTGLEFSIPLSEIGDPTGEIKLLAFVNGSGHDFASNQFSGAGIPPTVDFGLDGGNLGNFLYELDGFPPLLTLADIPGDQFVTLAVAAGVGVPEPSAALLMLFASLGATMRRIR